MCQAHWVTNIFSSGFVLKIWAPKVSGQPENVAAQKLRQKCVAWPKNLAPKLLVAFCYVKNLAQLFGQSFLTPQTTGGQVFSPHNLGTRKVLGTSPAQKLPEQEFTTNSQPKHFRDKSFGPTPGANMLGTKLSGQLAGTRISVFFKLFIATNAARPPHSPDVLYEQANSRNAAPTTIVHMCARSN